ncbi:CRISPR-associated helicase/endonuclease Cas3 [Caloramator proteoclasticus]|uniref:CRISPR-associated helicase, Cas3 family n=1 Tax=Caloramator proteoclasticus DSM 10124 TaxID=1121262 RepID=A0A1M4YIU8_9CLOT|nr:CRISPR-associated helicase/endonuclease Cas3 [Caloramator proteoclasticus]SHF05412.1 CRISPR-associated helicase, Cas3 family [Caloramator proteoclasticus DSM 10124]
MPFYSHPDKLLIEHLKEVYDINKGLFGDEDGEVYRVISFCHDFGKYTTYFQRHLFGKETSELSKHGFISAIFGGYVALNLLKEPYPLYVYLAILHHHGNLETPLEHLPKNFKKIDEGDIWVLDKINIFKKQMEDIKKNKDEIYKDYEMVGLGQIFNDFLEEDVLDILKELRKIHFKIERQESEIHYVNLLYFYSALISADKLSASNTKVLDDIGVIEYDRLNREREEKIKGKQDINGIRSSIFKNVLQNIEKNKDKSMFTITAPTGTGKTYTGFFSALKLRELLGGNRRIIYSLPFTSIIDQNYDVIEELFSKFQEYQSCKGRYLIKHHSMADVEYLDENMDYTKTQQELLIENWESGVVVTTFVQLLETLIGNRNRMLKKFVNIRGSIILLDEVQAIDIKYYPLIDFIFNLAVKYLEVKIIMMTATKPAILNGAVELLEGCDKYFSLFNRTKLIPRLESISVGEFIQEFKENIQDKSYLIVCNTINQSIEIFSGLKDLDRDVYYLSTNLVPKHRRERIKEVSERLKRGDKIILVSTQVVEAGVDFDFDVVIRDLAPLDSIIQCAGRCNRNGKKELGEVYVYKMVNEKGELFSKHVYGNTSVNITKELIENKEVIFEKDYYNLINDYFKMVINNKQKDVSNGYIESIKRLIFTGDYKYPLSRFSLIENNPTYIDVFVEVDDEAVKTLKKYFEILLIKDYEKRREEYLKIKNQLNYYFISVPEKTYKNFENRYGIFVLPQIALKDYYNVDTGLIREKDETFMIF